MIQSVLDWVNKYWKSATAVCAFIILVGTLPGRVANAEKKNEQQDQLMQAQQEALIELKTINDTWQKIYQQQQQQQAPPQPWTFLRQEGDIQIFRDPDDVIQCCDGTTCWAWTPKRKCRRD